MATTQTVSPWGPFGDQLQFALQEARRLYDQGPPAYFPGPIYLPPAPQTQAALALLEGRARAGSPLLQAAQGVTQRSLQGGYLGANPADPYLRALAAGQGPASPAARHAAPLAAGGQANPALANVAGLADGSADAYAWLRQLGLAGPGAAHDVAAGIAGGGQSNPALAHAQAGARGDWLHGNPHLDAAYQRAARQVQDQVNAQFGRAGRAGSGAHADLLSRNLGDVATDLYGRAYETERDRQLQSQALLAQLGQQAVQNRLAGAELAGGLREQALGRGLQAATAAADRQLSAASLQGQLAQHDMANRLEALGLLQGDHAQAQANRLSAASLLGRHFADERALQMRAAGAAPALAAQDYADPQRLLGVGEARQAYDLAALQDSIARHDFAQAAPAAHLAQLMGLLQGAPAFATTQTTSRPVAADALGGARAGVDLVGALTGDPWLRALGGLGGGLLGLFG